MVGTYTKEILDMAVDAARAEYNRMKDRDL